MKTKSRAVTRSSCSLTIFGKRSWRKIPDVIGRILRIKGIEFTVGGVALAPRRPAALDAKSADDAIAGGTVDSGRWYHPP